MLTNKRFYLNTIFATLIAGLVYAILILLPIQQTSYANLNMIISGSLVFINYLMVSYLFFKKESMPQKFFSVPLIRVLFSFFSFYILFFFLYTYLRLPEYIILITYLVILLINVFTFYRVYLATNIIKNIEQKETNARDFINDFSNQLLTIEATILTTSVKKKLKSIREDLKYTSPLSQPSVKSIEQTLVKLLKSTEFNDLDEDEVDVVMNQIKSLIENRQSILKK